MKYVLLPLVFVLSLVVSPLAATSAGVIWSGKRVAVIDYTSPDWEGVVQETVADLNAMLPKATPRFVYKRGEDKPCNEVGKQKSAIVVCSGDATPITCRVNDEASGQTCWWYREHRFESAVVWLSDWWPDAWADAGRGDVRHNQEILACHELMHAITGIGDRYDSRPDTSCVHGSLPDPGPFDTRYAKKVYKKHLAK